MLGKEKEANQFKNTATRVWDWWFDLIWLFILTYHLYEHVLSIYTKILKVSE